MVAVARETRTMTMKDAINEALRIAMREDPNVILLGEDIAGGAAVDHLIDQDAWGGPMGVTKGLV
jgi:pyruvate/2-oxoglutarate/acetoin dehydrogenase E1 component